jgi:hypothetical protein
MILNLSDASAEISRDLVKSALRSTCPLFLAKEHFEDRFEFHASGVLVSFGSVHVILSAAHVVHGERSRFKADRLRIPVSDSVLSGINGECIFTSLPDSGIRNHDAIDLCLIVLDDGSHEMLRNHHEFLNRDQVRMNVDPTMTEMTFAAGYPADWISVDPSNPRHYRVQPYHVLSRLSTDMTGLDNKPYSLKHNLILPAGADTRGEEYRGQKLESLEGVSGSGLWQRTGFNEALAPQKGLVGSKHPANHIL